MVDIDYIFELIDWNNSIEDQLKGVTLAKEVQAINAFLQPCNERQNKNVWDNCAKIIAARSDEELTPYLTQLFEWLRDFNWPGAIAIFNRLLTYNNSSMFEYFFNVCYKYAHALNEEVWMDNLRELKSARKR